MRPVITSSASSLPRAPWDPDPLPAGGAATSAHAWGSWALGGCTWGGEWLPGTRRGARSSSPRPAVPGLHGCSGGCRVHGAQNAPGLRARSPQNAPGLRARSPSLHSCAPGRGCEDRRAGLAAPDGRRRVPGSGIAGSVTLLRLSAEVLPARSSTGHVRSAFQGVSRGNVGRSHVRRGEAGTARPPPTASPREGHGQLARSCGLGLGCPGPLCTGVTPRQDRPLGGGVQRACLRPCQPQGPVILGYTPSRAPGPVQGRSPPPSPRHVAGPLPADGRSRPHPFSGCTSCSPACHGYGLCLSCHPEECPPRPCP